MGRTHQHRAALLRVLGRREEAVEAYREALRFDPLDAESRVGVLGTQVELRWGKERIKAFMEEFAEPGSGSDEAGRTGSG